MDSNGGSATRPPPPSRQLDYTCTQLQGALMHLASIDPIELCNEAKIEHCRATRDLRSCRRYVHSVLTSCGHASLCEECSQRCDVCPICRVPLPKEGTRLRLYYECIGAGLISKRCDDRFQDEEESEKHLVPDVQRLYSLFDVALENNLSSLICHYISDVCMDESAVSSDPVSAFLLDEVVVKDWCKQTFRTILSDIQAIYNGSVDEMFRNLDSLLKFSAKLASITNILEVLESSFKDSHAAILHDVHCLQENISKSKQHMEIMAWSIRHNFLENVASQHENIFTWRSVVHERNSAAVSRVWPDSDSSAQQTSSSTLFIEDALSNLEVEQEVADIQGEEYHIEFLQKEGNSSYYPSGISVMAGCYPFENLRAATDILFLRGSPDLVVAKQAIFLYYLFDRHWTRPEEDWRHIIDDFAATFSISRHLLLESFIFYLLDECSSEALQEACRILPEISGPTIHPKVAQVLLERQNPYAALMVMRWSGRDGAELASLGEAITAVRVRIECGFLTEAFMYQRTACMKLKDKSSQKGNGDLKDDRRSWSVWVEALVLEICYLCIRRNLVEQMIDLPWNKDEEKYIHRCLLDFVTEDPSTAYGSLLVVYYLQRYHYIDAYQVDQKLQNVEQDFIAKGSATGEVLSKMRSTSQWRAGLIGKSIDLLPDVLQQKLKAGTLSDEVASPGNEVGVHEKAEVSREEENISTGFAAPHPHGSSILLGVDNTTTSLKCPLPETPLKMNGSLNNIKMTFGGSSPLTTLFSDADKSLRPKSSFTKGFNFDKATPPSHAVGYPSPSPLRNINGSSTRAQSNRSVPSYQVNEKSPETSLSGFASKFRATSHGNNQGRFTGLAQSKMADRSPSPNDMMEISWSNGNGFQPEDVNGGARWRSDEASDDEEYQTPVTSQGKLARATRRSRRLRG